MPMSYNKWLYGYGNPMRYTDPSGNFALIDTLFAGVVGAAGGVLVGATIGACTYDKALTGQCGCDWKQKAFSMTRKQWSEEFMIGGAIAGALFGVATTLPSITLTGGALIAAGITKIAIGGFIIAISIPEVIDAYHRIEDVGANWCSVGRFIYALFILAGGIALVGSGIIDVAKGTSQVIAASNIVNDAYNVPKLQARWGAKVNWSGKPHPNNTPGHWERIVQKVDAFWKDPNVEEIYINKGIKNVTPLNGAPNNRPDIMVVYKNGTIDVFEVKSKTDVVTDLIARSISNLKVIGGKAGKYEIFYPLVE